MSTNLLMSYVTNRSPLQHLSIPLTRAFSIANPLSTSLPTSFTSALETVSTLPDIESAQQVLDYSTAQSHYQRTISILDRQRDQNPLLSLAAREHYAAFLHHVGDVSGEWEQRKMVAVGVGGGRMWNALAVCGMRGGEDYRQGIQWAGEQAREGRSDSDRELEVGLGVLGALNSGIAMGERGKVVVQGVAKMANGIDVCGVDVAGWANVFVGLASGGVEGGNLLKAVAQKWESRLDEKVEQDKNLLFQTVELLCAAGKLMVPDEEGKDGDAIEIFQKALKLSKKGGGPLDVAEPLLCLADLYVKRGEPVMAEGLYRSIEDKFRPLLEKRAFTVSAADVFARAMDGYSRLLTAMEFNGMKRTKEGTIMAQRASEARGLFPQVFENERVAPLYYIDALMPKLASVPP